jgi:hypothetical protein
LHAGNIQILQRYRLAALTVYQDFEMEKNRLPPLPTAA